MCLWRRVHQRAQRNDIDGVSETKSMSNNEECINGWVHFSSAFFLREIMWLWQSFLDICETCLQFSPLLILIISTNWCLYLWPTYYYSNYRMEAHHHTFLRFLQVTHMNSACYFVTISDCPSYRLCFPCSCTVLSCRAKEFLSTTHQMEWQGEVVWHNVVQKKILLFIL